MIRAGSEAEVFCDEGGHGSLLGFGSTFQLVGNDTIEPTMAPALGFEMAVDHLNPHALDLRLKLGFDRLEPLQPLALTDRTQPACLTEIGGVEGLLDFTFADRTAVARRNDHAEPVEGRVGTLPGGDQTSAHMDHLNGPPDLV